MAKIRDYDAELRALGERAKLIKQRKVQQFGELVEATGADALDPDLLAGALLAAVATRDKPAQDDWRKRGSEFFHVQTRRRPPKADIAADSGGAARPSSEPGRGGAGPR